MRRLVLPIRYHNHIGNPGLEDDVDAATAAVWAIDELPCRRRAVKRLRSIDSEFPWLREHHNIEGAISARLGSRPPERFVAPVQPSRLNARMALQQGVFVCLGDPGSDLFGNLEDTVDNEDPLRIVKIEFPRAERSEALWALRRLNTSRETLFPGLDGLARSLSHLFVPRRASNGGHLKSIGLPRGWPGPRR